MKVFIRDALHAYEREAFASELAQRGSEVTGDRSSAEALITGGATLREEELEAMPRLRRVVRFARARADDHRELELLRARGIVRAEVRGASAAATAEHALALLLALLRRLPEYSAAMMDGAWCHASPDRAAIRDLSEVTVGVAGFGEVGQRLVRQLVALGATVLVARRSSDADAVRAAGAEMAGIDELVARADAICLAARTPETILTRERIAALRYDAVVVSVGAGTAVDLAALRDAVARGALRVALDVYPDEPPDPEALPRDRSRVILTPHVAGRSRATARTLAMRVAEAVDGRARDAMRELVLARLRERRWSDFDVWDELFRRFERTSLAGRRIFIRGYGADERRVAFRARELHLLVTIVEPDARARLDALLDGFACVAAHAANGDDVVLTRPRRSTPVSEEEIAAAMARLDETTAPPE